VKQLGFWMNKTEDALDDVTTNMHNWLGRAFSAKTVIERHVTEFHGFGDTERARFCFPTVEPPSLGSEGDVSSLPLIKSLQVQGTRERMRFGVYFASATESATLRKHYQTISLSSHMHIERISCPSALTPTQLLKCAAERCFADLYDYILPAHHSWTLSGHRWGHSIAKEMKSRGDLGAVELVAAEHAVMTPIVIVSRVHMRVFGVKLFHPSVQSLRMLAPFLRQVYGTDFYSSLALTKAGVQAHTWLDDEQQEQQQKQQQQQQQQQTQSDNVSITEAQSTWRTYLCRHKLWARFCVDEDVRFFSNQPHHHVGKSLSRDELESMENAAKKG
jgi:hypothetical protein